MASDKKAFNRSNRKWHELHASGAYSLPMHLGRTAILWSRPFELKESFAVLRDQKKFKRESRAIADLYRQYNLRTEIIDYAEVEDYDAVMQDPEYSNVIVIAHGHLSAIDAYCSYDGNTLYDWQDVSQAADHLKTGFFVQRHCARSVYDLPVPLGMFAVSKFSHVLAPVHRAFTPRDLADPVNSFIQPVTQAQQFSYRSIKQAFEQPADIHQNDEAADSVTQRSIHIMNRALKLVNYPF